MNSLKLCRFMPFIFLSSALYCYTENDKNNSDAVSVAENFSKENDEDTLVYKKEIVYKKRKDVKSEDKGKYIPINVDGIPILFEITGDFADNWHPRWPMFSFLKYEEKEFNSDYVSHRIETSTVLNFFTYTESYTKKRSNKLYYLNAMKKFQVDGPKFSARLYSSKALNLDVGPFIQNQSKSTEFTDDECIVIDTHLQDIKSTDVGKFILFGVNLPINPREFDIIKGYWIKELPINLPITFKIIGDEFNDDWYSYAHTSKTIKGQNFIKLVFYDKDGKEIGPILLNAFKSLDYMRIN